MSSSMDATSSGRSTPCALWSTITTWHSAAQHSTGGEETNGQRIACAVCALLLLSTQQHSELAATIVHQAPIHPPPPYLNLVAVLNHLELLQVFHHLF